MEQNKNTKALELLTSPVSRLAAIQERIAKLDEAKAAGGSAIIQEATASTQERFQMRRERAAYQKLMGGGASKQNVSSPKFFKDAVAEMTRLQQFEIGDEAKQSLFDRGVSAIARLRGTTGNDVTAEGRAIKDAAGGGNIERLGLEADDKNTRLEAHKANLELQKNLSRDLPAFIKNLNEQLVTMLSSVGNAANSAFNNTTGDQTGFNQRNLDSFANSTKLFDGAISRMAGAKVQHSIAPLVVSVNHTGLGNIEDGLIPLIEKITQQKVKEYAEREKPV